MHAAPGPRSPALPVPDGILVIDKPEGPTSHDVVARVRRALGVRQVGHTGTLDPMATGVLALLVGRATRLAQFLSAGEKTYRAVVRLGTATETWDRTGTVLERFEEPVALLSPAAVEEALAGFVGEREQVPPPFSAKKVEGVRAYRLARQGRPAAMRAAQVTLHSVTMLFFDPPLVGLEIRCSAGFYVRALAHDLGGKLGCGGCLEALRRTAAGGQGLEQALTLDSLERDPASAAARMVPMERALPGVPTLVLSEPGAKRVLHGNDVGPDDLLEPPATLHSTAGASSTGSENARRPLPAGFGAVVQLLGPDGRLLAIARPGVAPGALHPAVVLK